MTLFERARYYSFTPGRPANFEPVDAIVLSKTKMSYGLIERQITPTCFQLTHLVSLAARTVVNRERCADTISIANFIFQLKGNAIARKNNTGG